MSAIWPSAVATDADLYVAKNSLQTTLATAVNNSVTSVVLASATGFPTAGGVTIDNEVIFYTGISGATLTGCTRGADGTTAASHSVGVPVGASIIAFHHNGLMAEIEAIESYLDTVLGKGTLVTATEFSYVHGVTSALQTQLNLLAPKASPVFTGSVQVPAGSAGTPSVNFTGHTNYGVYLNGTTITLSIAAADAFYFDSAAFQPASNNALDIGQSSLNFRSVYFSTSLKNGSTTLATATEVGYLSGVTSAIQTQMDLKAPKASPTFTGTLAVTSASIPAMTVIGSANGAAPRVFIDNSNTTAGQSRTSILTVSGDNQSKGATLQGGKDSSNNAVSMVSGDDFIDLAVSGVAYSRQVSTAFRPISDNAITCGASGLRWSAVWAANGTIQTSMAATKTNIEYMEPDECKIPKAIYFNRPTDNHDLQQLGFEADILPEEAHPVIDAKTGERSTEDVYTSSVIAMLCQAARNDYERLANQDKTIASLEARLAALEAK